MAPSAKAKGKPVSEDEAAPKVSKTRATSTRTKKEPTRTFSSRMAAKASTANDESDTSAAFLDKAATQSGKRKADEEEGAASTGTRTVSESVVADATMIDHEAPKAAKAKKTTRATAAKKTKKAQDANNVDNIMPAEKPDEAEEEAAALSDSDVETVPKKGKRAQKAATTTKAKVKAKTPAKRGARGKKAANENVDEQDREDEGAVAENLKDKATEEDVLDTQSRSPSPANGRIRSKDTIQEKTQASRTNSQASTKRSRENESEASTSTQLSSISSISPSAPDLDDEKSAIKKTKVCHATRIVSSSSSGRQAKKADVRSAKDDAQNGNEIEQQEVVEQAEAPGDMDPIHEVSKAAGATASRFGTAEQIDEGDGEWQDLLPNLARIRGLSEAERQMTVEKWLLLQGEHICNEMWKKGTDEINKLRERGQRDRSRMELILRGL